MQRIKTFFLWTEGKRPRIRRKIEPATADELSGLDDVDRPRNRVDCKDEPRPCPFVSCRYHLYLDVHPTKGHLRLAWPGHELEDMPETCALDVADRQGATLFEVGQVMNLTRERIRQIEVRALRVLDKKIKDEDR